MTLDKLEDAFPVTSFENRRQHAWCWASWPFVQVLDYKDETQVSKNAMATILELNTPIKNKWSVTLESNKYLLTLWEQKL